MRCARFPLRKETHERAVMNGLIAMATLRCTHFAVSVALVACARHGAPAEGNKAAPAATTPPAVEIDPSVVSLPAREPPASELVVLLHGVGATAASFQDIGRALAPALPRADFIVPDGFHPFDRAPTGRQWFSMGDGEHRAERVREAGGEVSRWIDSELARRGLGGDRLVIVGFSQGAMVAAWLAVHRQVHPAAVVMLSGLVADDGAPVSGASPTPVFVAHGDRDRVISVSYVEPGVQILQAWGARVTTRIYPGLDHHVDPQELSDVREFLAREVSPK